MIKTFFVYGFLFLASFHGEHVHLHPEHSHSRRVDAFIS